MQFEDNIDEYFYLNESTYCCRWGPKSDFAVVFMHGIESHSDWFREFAQRLNRRGFTCWSYDRKGWGKSRGSRGLLASKRALIKEWRGFLKKSGVKRPFIVGQSWGGLLAAQLKIDYKEDIFGAALVSPGIYPYFGLHDIPMKDMVRGRIDLPYSVKDFTCLQDYQAYLNNDPLRIERISALTGLVTRQLQRDVKRSLGNLKNENVRVLLSTEDKIIDYKKTLQSFRRAGVRVHSFEDCSHAILWEKADELEAIVLEQIDHA